MTTNNTAATLSPTAIMNLITLTLKAPVLHALLTGQVTEVMHLAADGDHRSGIEGVTDSCDFNDFGVKDGVSEFMINGKVMVLNVTRESCYDSDPEHCPCCAWETWSFQKV
jgi:hypothetical protein